MTWLNRHRGDFRGAVAGAVLVGLAGPVASHPAPPSTLPVLSVPPVPSALPTEPPVASTPPALPSAPRVAPAPSALPSAPPVAPAPPAVAAAPAVASRAVVSQQMRDVSAKKNEILLNCVKNFADLGVAMYLTKVVDLSQGKVGFLGVVSALIGAYQLYPPL